MDQLLFVMMRSVHVFLSALMLLLFLRVLIGFFSEEESGFLVFCSIVTEPVVYPIRLALSHIPGIEDSPIDFSFMATYLVLILVQSALPVSF
ncbi:MAG: hypothetical protein E7586_01870 [Ruminococcaceae bacterium]|nr:hypothetical protein [Oscillospiraceae bacterium]